MVMFALLYSCITVTYFVTHFISPCAKCFQLVKYLDCRKDNAHLESSIMKPCCCNGCSMRFQLVLVKHAKHSLKNNLIWVGAYVPINLYIAFSIDGAIPDVQAANFLVTGAPLSHHRCRLLNWELKTSWMNPLLFSQEDTVFIFSENNFKCKFFWPQNSFSFCLSPF